MAKAEELPIYTTSYNLLQVVTKNTKNFPKEYKFNLGSKLLDACIDLTITICYANATKEKELYLIQILEKAKLIELLSRLCKDQQLFSIPIYSSIVVHTSSVLKQATGWLKSSTRQSVIDYKS
jgi:hypothetical protein